MLVPLPPSSAAAFELPSRRGEPRARALCIHGYTGTPYELLPMALALADAGLACTGIVLPGHEGDPRVLDVTPWTAWADAAERALFATRDDAPVFLVGSSMGALLSLHLAAAHPARIAGLILLAPALTFFRDGRAVARAAQQGLWRLKRAIPKERPGGDVSSEEARALNPSYRELPVRGIGELGRLQAVVAGELARVTAPVCVLHGAQDHTIPAAASEQIARGVSSAHVEHHVLRNSWHLIGIDVDRHQVCSVAASFIDEVLHGGRRRQGARA